jgi:anti-sigma regulatory factor (Ser/Thr protein kinase)
MKRESWLTAAPESAPIARAIVRDAAVEHGLGADATWDLELATTEAVANAILHGSACEYGNGSKGILLRVLPCHDGLCVEVCDCGQFDSERVPPTADATSGRGIRIMAAVVDQFAIVPHACQTRVRFGKRRDLAAA